MEIFLLYLTESLWDEIEAVVYLFPCLKLMHVFSYITVILQILSPLHMS